MSEMNLPSTVGHAPPRSSPWPAEVWDRFRPYLIKLGVDFLIFVAIWCVLWAAHRLTKVLPLGTQLSEFLVGFHETMVVLTFVWISMVALWVLVILSRKV